MANIVVLDDDSDLCSFVKTALERDGHMVRSVMAGAALTLSLIHI